MDWKKITNDPTDKETVTNVVNYLNSIRRGIKNNDDILFLENKVTNKSVLDIGVAEHTVDRIQSDTWKHRRIAAKASYCLGVDILEDMVNYLKSLGFNVKTIDATSDTDLGDRFDVVHAGDVIEHVDSPVQLLKFCARHVKDEGIVLVRTPNPYCYDYVLGIIRNGTDRSNLEHVCYVTPTQALELGRRSGLILTNYYTLTKVEFGIKGLNFFITYLMRGKIIHAFIQTLAPDEIVSTIYIYEYRRAIP